jgi:hypothetical protein
MRNGNGNTLMGLIKELAQQIKIFFRQEIQLATTEISEKLASYGKDAALVAIGGFVAYAGLIVLLGGLGLLLAFAFVTLGWEPLVATFAGLGIMGLLVIAAGALVLLKGIKAFSKESIVPERTMETIYHLRGTEPPVKVETQEKQKKPSSEEIEARVIVTENIMAGTLAELTNKVSLTNVRRRARDEVEAHPYKWGLIAMGTGLAGSFILKKKLHRLTH